MKGSLRIAVLSLLLVSTDHAIGFPPQDPEATQADCSFSHPQLPGRCNVTVPVPGHSTPRQACDAVLRCINGTVCADAEKYCRNPGVPKTWKLEEAIAARPRVNCAYTNQTSSGWCRLTAPVPKGMTPQEACEAVLPCLNGSPCDGYIHPCDPDNRSGWKLAEVSPVQPPPTPKR